MVCRRGGRENNRGARAGPEHATLAKPDQMKIAKEACVGEPFWAPRENTRFLQYAAERA
jgi:hypothetical protein